MNNRRQFLKKISLLGLIGSFSPILFGKDNKKIILYGYNWQYYSFNFNGMNYECKYYPNKSNRNEYIYYPPNPITKEQDPFYGIKYIHRPSFDIETIQPYVDGMYYYKNGEKFKIISKISHRTGFSNICCAKDKFEIA